METIKAIQTKYNGIRFRSRTEARWAVFMDEIGMPYVYEAEGFVFKDGTTYLPDFWLPDQCTFLECKGIMSDKDLHKIKMLVLEHETEVVVGYSDMTFDVFDESYLVAGSVAQSKAPWIVKCFLCGKKYFINGDHNINVCRCCGQSWRIDDAKATTATMYGYVHGHGIICASEISNAFSVAKSARFEFGEDGMNG